MVSTSSVITRSSCPNEANPAPSGKELVGGLKRASEKVERLAERVHRRERYVEGAGLLG
jgi:hypothetical protein